MFRLVSTAILGAALAVPLADAAAGEHRVVVEARVSAEAEPLSMGVEWRVFGEAEDGRLVERAAAAGGRAELSLEPGRYYLNALYGQASRTLRLDVEGDTERSVVLGAGGLRLDATAGGEAIAPDLLRFDIFRHRPDENGERRTVATDVAPRDVVRLNAGTYHVLSRYGRLRAEVRADLVVRAGETTTAVMQHRGAEARLRLVSAPGGAPLANTAWSVFSDQGEQLYDAARTAPRIVLPEGDYEVVARNGADVVKQAFTVRAGRNLDIELLLP